MITFKSGNLFDSKCTTIVNTINTLGVMGAGIALEYKKRYPEMFKWYFNECKLDRISTGHVYLWKSKFLDIPRILLFPTKDKWWDKSEISYITSGLNDFRDKYESFKIDSIAFPKLGCNNGGLNWDDVRPIMIDYLSGLPIEIEIYDKDFVE